MCHCANLSVNAGDNKEESADMEEQEGSTSRSMEQDEMIFFPEKALMLRTTKKIVLMCMNAKV